MVTLAEVKNRTDISVIILAYLSFVVLGMPGAMLGVAWLAIQPAFALPLDAVGVLLAFAAGGYALSSFYSGRMVYRFGYPRLLIVSNAVVIIGALGYVVAPVWELILLSGMIMGIGGGAIDAGLNTYFAAYYGPRLMSWLHASFGIGTVLAPYMMTRLLERALPWQWGYGVIALASGLLIAAIALTARQWRQPEISSKMADMKAGLRHTLRLPVVWLTIAVMTLVVSVEVSPSQWIPSLFTKSRSMTVELAGLMVTLYWGGFTFGRILYGMVGSGLKPVSALRVCMAATGLGALFVWIDAGPALNFLGVAIMGLAQAPIFPLMVSVTPERVGSNHAANAIGFIISAAGIGVAILPGLVGVLADSLGLEIIGLLLVVMVATMFGLHEALVQRKAPV